MRTLSTDPDVRPGQVWADNDKRSAGRHVKVLTVDAIAERVTVEACDPNGVVHRNAAGKTVVADDPVSGDACSFHLRQEAS